MKCKQTKAVVGFVPSSYHHPHHPSRPTQEKKWGEMSLFSVFLLFVTRVIGGQWFVKFNHKIYEAVDSWLLLLRVYISTFSWEMCCIGLLCCWLIFPVWSSIHAFHGVHLEWTIKHFDSEKVYYFENICGFIYFCFFQGTVWRNFVNR